MERLNNYKWIISVTRMFFMIALILFVVSNSGYAAPSLTSISGTFVHNGPITISGSGFGSKASPNPVAWDNLEKGTVSTSPTIGSWSNTNELKINSTNNRNAFSKFNGLKNFVSGDYGYFTGGAPSKTWYAQYWFKLGSNWSWGTTTDGKGHGNLANVKFFRMWSPGSTNENFVIAYHGFAGSALYANENISDGVYFWSTFARDVTLNTWHLLEFEYQDSDVNAGNGVIRVWLDGSQKLSLTNMITRKASSDYKRPFIVGFYDSWNDSSASNAEFYIDDIYIDNTWSRVVIGDKAIFSQCSRREIQIPTQWSSNSISINVNQGSFNSGDTVYLFVVDSNGNVNSEGTPINIGGTGGGTSEPQAPKGLILVPQQ